MTFTGWQLHLKTNKHNPTENKDTDFEPNNDKSSNSDVQTNYN